MPPNQPINIDYARAESDDVVRKKFRRRVVWFVAVTVVVMVIGVGWAASWNRVARLFGGEYWNSDSPVCVATSYGEIQVWGPNITTTHIPSYQEFGNYRFGIRMQRNYSIGQRRWFVGIRYRTLFLLAMIPWIITLIRMIRSWKRKRLETEPRTQ